MNVPARAPLTNNIRYLTSLPYILAIFPKLGYSASPNFVSAVDIQLLIFLHKMQGRLSCICQPHLLFIRPSHVPDIHSSP